MRIGLIVQLHGAPGTSRPPHSWERLRELATTAEAVGFDSLVFEDALLYRTQEATFGLWESVSIAGALAAATSRIHVGHSVLNSPYRSPAMTAKIAATLDEISGGRYIFGIGAGNTPDSDYEAFGFPTDRRYSRFAEAIEIIHGLLKDGRVDYQGTYWSAIDAELVLRGPRPQGPPIVIAAGGPKMLRLTARYADVWNWWSTDHRSAFETLSPLIEVLDQACVEEGREPATLGRTLDFYKVDPLGRALADGAPGEGIPLSGSEAEIAETILSFGALGFTEVRCDVYPKTPEGVEAMAEVVRLVKAG